ncbi:NAD-dependent epimerase/dehydratase [Cytophagales bacterium LB-30]|uniref:NAD-dependent epimerase/dehydratase n=1 Tax=Shiella aurantiaca TaxID=3058365 RepID=A0ABT8F401_9BACT|nr:NAD-dependent epimerase/dehydratase [Shiella aurantiaca]MDN4165187.1 NAD-dependent epimerase/dehydratase [Shiella aurantiaca]
MRVVVTGGAGYVGTELVNALILLPEVEQVVVYDNLSRPNFNYFIGHKREGHQKFQFIHGELLDSRKLRKVLQNTDVVFHLAAKVTTPFANTDAHMYEQINHWGTAELVYAIEESPVKHLVYLSSTSVYGNTKQMVSLESAPNPTTFYGISKLRGEEHVNRLSDKIKTHIIRCGNVYGFSKSMRFDAVINRFMFDANFTNRISIHGNGRQHRAFIHINHVTQVLQSLIGADLGSGVYNLVDKNLQVLDIVEVLKEIYLDLEFIFINQHMGLNELSVDNKEALHSVFRFESRSLLHELQEFKEKFAF